MNPGQRSTDSSGSVDPYHGRLSSASTGRFAALLFPFVFELFELNMIESLIGGASMSISSS